MRIYIYIYNILFVRICACIYSMYNVRMHVSLGCSPGDFPVGIELRLVGEFRELTTNNDDIIIITYSSRPSLMW